MLRRTKGRLLLTLLVVTGLAGTINDTALSKKERILAISLMKDTKTEIIKNVKGLSPSQLNYKPAADAWSVKECVYHIALSERNLWSILETTMKSPANREKRSQIILSDEQLIEMMEDHCNNVNPSETFGPEKNSWKTTDAALVDFKNKRTAHIKYINSSTEDLRDHVIQMSFGWIDCYQLCLMMAAHSNRHIQQINEIKIDPGFPNK